MFATIDSIIERDPAARSRIQVILTYSGYQAEVAHRVSHWLHRHHRLLMADLVAHVAKQLTGVEIHPGAQLGKRLFIDHGYGVVIGETAIVGDDVTMHHAVTLGGRKEIVNRRHPKIGNRVLIGANALVLGAIEVHDDAKIGAGSVVVKDVAAGKTVVGNAARIIN
ncbi:serine acetyltransferase [Periweissella cryptocerci]|uniref:Serine acetyltransferase n=1 Tax=Periweissella cryptocerci TaxID=2506420 RepID=A0A4P6YU00_9LACO|nr:serine O-acetyltransferase EpsC [Periweissella cryptocerci]QBO36181.1 serine acetyltransferase [Periweissella cryptocerci]